MSKTPNFDAALDKIFADLKPHTRVCSETGESFDITERDIEMLKLLRVPPPKTVWWAAIRRQRAFLGGVDLFRRVLPNGQSIVTMYDPESTVPIIPLREWQSDAFETLAFGKDVDANRPFFEQWRKFSERVSRPAMIQGPSNENSEWALDGLYQKNCYFTYGGTKNEDLMYSDICISCLRSSDLTICSECADCFGLVDCTNCTNVFFSERSERCSDSAFLLECRNCADCFGCSNLRNKKFCFLNEQLGEEEYRKQVAAIDLADSRTLDKWRTRIEGDVWSKSARPANHTQHCERSVGDGLYNCAETRGIMVFDSKRAWDAVFVLHCTDVWRMTSAVYSENCFGCVTTNQSSRCVSTIACNSCMDVEYSELLSNCAFCFGCIGLRNKKFCVFNKQYSEEEYWPLVDAIKTAMLERGEFGQFFPYELSPFAFNTSHGGNMYPLSPAEVAQLGARWYGFESEKQAPASSIDELPTRLADTTVEQLAKKYRCPVTGRPFGFVAPEIELHRSMKIALPRLHPTARRLARLRSYLPFLLHDRKCDSCGKQVETRIPPEHAAPIFCPTCYEQIMIGEKSAPVVAVPPLAKGR